MASAGNGSVARESSAKQEICASSCPCASWLVKRNYILRLGQATMPCAPVFTLWYGTPENSRHEE
jgi:hypothetical protein